ncbi:hypothetical protein H2248_004077 [Termitomyces sp. 'cryptogamus']|nr:hypothetical protein H2248_004077 [Termitomyces sp. 'cryptogamus']
MLHRKPPKVLKVLAIIIDMGVAFLLLQGLTIVLKLLPFNHYSASDFFQTVISSAYVSLTQRSFVEAFELSDPNANGTPEVPFNRTITSGPLELAHPDTSTDSISLTDVSDMGFTDTSKGTIIILVDSFAQEKTQDMVEAINMRLHCSCRLQRVLIKPSMTKMRMYIAVSLGHIVIYGDRMDVYCCLKMADVWISHPFQLDP